MRRGSSHPRISSAPVQVVVVAKEPVAGRVKTRLCPPLSLEQAANLTTAALMDTMDAITAARVLSRTVVLEGSPGDWLPKGVGLIKQRSGSFGDRLAGAIDDAYGALPLPVLLVGMDTPQLDAGLIETAAKALLKQGTDAVLGLAHDGGFWVIGVRRPVPGLFEGVQMSTSQTGTQQLARLDGLGLECVQLARLRDVDVWDDAIEVARASPRTRFAAVLGTCGLPGLSRGATASV